MPHRGPTFVPPYMPNYSLRRMTPERWDPAPAVWILVSFLLGLVAGVGLAAGWLPCPVPPELLP